MESFVPAVLKSDCAVCLCVYDDSDTPNAAVHITEGLLKLREKYGVPIRLVTKKNRLQFVERLKREGAKNNIPPEIIDFGLTDVFRAGKALGINRNIALLDNIGRIIISNDDDVSNHFIRSPCYRPGIKLSSVVNPRRMQLYESREALMDDIEPIDIDVVAEHGFYLGKTIGEIVKKEERKSGPVDIPSAMFCEVENCFDDGGTVIITLPGIFGVNTGKIPSSFLMWKPGAPEYGNDGKGEYYKKILSTECIYTPPVTTITDRAYLTTPHFGLDARNLLPPFFPIFRGQDKIFGLLTKRCFPHYYYLYPSYAIFHKRRDSHTFDRGDLIKLNNSFSFQFSLLLDTCITTPLGKGLTCSLHEIGILLERFALQSDSDFTGCLRELFADYFTNYVDFLSSLKDRSSTEPQWWLEDVERYRQAVLAASRREDIIIPDEIKSLTGSFDGAVRFYKQLLSNYGKLCRHWEVIVEVARECEMPGEV